MLEVGIAFAELEIASGVPEAERQPTTRTRGLRSPKRGVDSRCEAFRDRFVPRDPGRPNEFIRSHVDRTSGPGVAEAANMERPEIEQESNRERPMRRQSWSQERTRRKSP